MGLTAEAAVVNNSVADANKLLALCIDLSSKEKAAKKVLKEISDQLKSVKEQVKDLFIDLGVKSMKTTKTVYLNRQIWAGTAEGVSNYDVTKALEVLSLENHITYNHQLLSAYVREIIKEHPEWYGEDGEVIAEPEDIIAALPEPLNKLLKVTEIIDIRIKN